ncbi:hypothetical protein LTR09_006447 [Extremus antarcticus]|uniref:Uncharacterized protein n=1 Tax=Extremus antarcticus TaxID=702011 RepID=A0AAJ0GDI8_9PEZI|nr:hypothetical protein LTR09_006447 [Extremus antarcticus]
MHRAGLQLDERLARTAKDRALYVHADCPAQFWPTGNLLAAKYQSGNYGVALTDVQLARATEEPTEHSTGVSLAAGLLLVDLADLAAVFPTMSRDEGHGGDNGEDAGELHVVWWRFAWSEEFGSVRFRI